MDDWGEVCHRVRESQRFYALHAVERRCPRTYGGLRGAVKRDAVRLTLTVACNELELRPQLPGATWTAARAHEHRIRTDSRCPHRGALAETDKHILWVCPTCEPAWRPLVEAAARPLPTLAVPSAWLACLRLAKLLPLALVPDDDALKLAKDRLYRLYGMFLAVLAARKRALDTAEQRGDQRLTVFGLARGRAPDARTAYPWHQLGAGPLPMPPARPPLDAPEACRRIGPGRRRFCMPRCGGQGPSCGSRARAKSRTWNWPWISYSIWTEPSRRLQGTSWRVVSCHFVNERTCSSSRSTKRNSLCVLVSFLGASYARYAMH